MGGSLANDLDSANEELAKQFVLVYAALMPNKNKWDHFIAMKNLDTLRNRWKMLREVADFAMSNMLDKMEKDFPEEDCSTFEGLNQDENRMPYVQGCPPLQ